MEQFRIDLVNDGASVAVWYQVRLKIPFTLCPKTFPSGLRIHPLVPDASRNWQAKQSDEHWEVLYSSEASHSLYPHQPRDFFYLAYPVRGEHAAQEGAHRCTYVVSTDRSRPRTDHLTFTVARAADPNDDPAPSGTANAGSSPGT
jgi:hypothetical protein